VTVRALLRMLWPLALAGLVASPVRAGDCDQDRAAEQAQRAAERAARVAEHAAEKAQREAEVAAEKARRGAEYAAQQARRGAEVATERAREIARVAQERAQIAAERAQRAGQRVAERVRRQSESASDNGVIGTREGMIFVDGPEVPWEDVNWADDARSRRISRPMITDTLLRVGRGISLGLTNFSGDIVVKVWDRSEVHIKAEHDRSDRFFASMKNDMLKLSMRPRESAPADVEWALTVPVWLPLEISGNEGDIAVTGLRSSLRAHTMRGDVTVHSCQGPIEIYSVEGDVRAEDVNGYVTAVSVNSDVRLVRVTGPVEAQSINGDIQMEDVASANVSASTMNGQVYYSSAFQPRGRYAFSSHNGKIHVGVDDAERVNYTVSSFSGEVQTTVPVPPVPEAPAPRPYRRAMRFSFPTPPATPEPAPPAPPAPAAPPASSEPAKAWVPSQGARGPQPLLSYTPRAPEVELESFSGLIQLASREVVERALELRRAKLDSLRALRGMARAHRFEYKMRFHEKKSEKSQDDEDRDKDKK